MYLQDPTITPFKTVPGSLPPLGVCHRVAREAKRTWPKASKDQEERFRFVSPFAQPVEVSMTSPRSGSSTPTGAAPKIFWPKESSTRRRLKELCKRKFSIAPHYQRLLQSRSPSPFLDSFIRRPASRSSTLPPTEDTTMAFATRDLGVSLMSTSASGPLAQLAVETHEQMDSDDWFNDPITPQKSTPASSSLSQGHLEASGHLLPPSTLPKLASPFTYNTWGPTRSRRSQRPALNQFDTIHATGPHLLSPARLDPFTNAHKRRAQNQLDQELSPGGSDIQDNLQKLFSPTSSGDVSQRRVRLRNRGFTLGAADARERLDSLFTPPNDMSMTQFDEPSNKPAGLAPPALDDAKRLGSPFELDSKKSFRSHSRTPRHAASSSESFITKSFANSIAVPSIEGRLAAFQSAQQRSSSPTHPTFDPMEEGITDAERIRRQLLNRYQEA
ncbi:hypothetical protein UCRPC4_g03011 [Phaeomoniella chlamydospora]|uniref:Uncharacterized protein n=1 Tax=Phaeomoniella chlamydospora TaxID=158046 RepID=A0A0G2ELI2_PHACM|nr:hypothetical protein UCRPC4_g03011 [Phaeomoniella chlamydospora]